VTVERKLVQDQQLLLLLNDQALVLWRDVLDAFYFFGLDGCLERRL